MLQPRGFSNKASSLSLKFILTSGRSLLEIESFVTIKFTGWLHMPPSLHSQYSCSSFINLLHTIRFFNSIKYFVFIFAKVAKCYMFVERSWCFFLPLQRIIKVNVLLCDASMFTSASNMALTGRFNTLDFTMNKTCLKITFSLKNLIKTYVHCRKYLRTPLFKYENHGRTNRNTIVTLGRLTEIRRVSPPLSSLRCTKTELSFRTVLVL